MKRKCFIGIRILCFLTLCICIMYYLSNVLTATQLEEYPQRNAFWQYMNAEEDNTIDIMFVGDSTIMHAINPMQIWKDTAITSYVMSYSMMKPQEAYFDMKKLLDKQSPKYVILDTAFLVNIVPDEFDYGRDTTRNIVNYIDDEFVGEIDYYLPVMKYKSAWKTRHFSDLLMSHPKSINNIFKGYKYAPEIIPYLGEHGEKTNGIVKYRNNGDLYFDKLFHLCKENNSELILISCPHRKGWNYEKYMKIKLLSDKYNVIYFDYDVNLEKSIPDFSWEIDTKDGGDHLNYSGATKTTDVFIDDFIEKYKPCKTKLTERQKDKWNRDMNEFYSFTIDKQYSKMQ